MKFKKLVTIPETQEEQIVKVTCDLCQSEIKSNDIYGVDDVVVKWDLGSHYPEGRLIERYSVDMCSDCFASKLMPWLKSQGANVLIEDPD